MGAFLFLVACGALAAAPFEARVARVLDGDSFVLADGRQARLIGVNAPELGHPCRPGERDRRRNEPCIARDDQPLARAARARLAALIENRQVRLLPGSEPLDRHGRLLVHAELADGRSVEELLLEEGLAWRVAIAPNIARVQRHGAAEQRARRERRGVWNEAAYAPVAASELARLAGGFRLVRGKIQAVHRSAHNLRFELARDVVLVISHNDWRKYFQRELGAPETLRGRELVVRGWMSVQGAERRVRLSHPAMLTWLQ